MATARGERIGVLTSNDDIVRLADLSAVVVGFGPDGNLEQIAARLYAALRELDRSSLDAILARDVLGTKGLALAIRDRLRRAAAGRVVNC
jgi:L-threonylcarbamoyladenylate synthase